MLKRSIKKYFIDMKFPCGCRMFVTLLKEEFQPECSYAYEDVDISIDKVTFCQECKSTLNNELTQDDLQTILEEIAYDVLVPLDELERIDSISTINFNRPLKECVLGQEFEYETE